MRQHGRIAVCIEGETPQIVEVLGNVSNNQAEYIAVFEALKQAEDGDLILTDSQLVVGQLTKGWDVNAESIKPMFEKCRELLDLKRIKVEWVSRNDSVAGRLLEKKIGTPLFEGMDTSKVLTTDEKYQPREEDYHG
jgi:ribonuclease HI